MAEQVVCEKCNSKGYGRCVCENAAPGGTVESIVELRRLVKSKLQDECKLIMHCVHAHGITDTLRVDAYRKGVMDVLKWAEQSNPSRQPPAPGCG